MRYGLGGIKVGGGSHTTYSVTVIQAPGEDKFFYDATTTVMQATGNPITGTKSTEFFPNSRGKATGITSTNAGLLGNIADDDRSALAKLAPQHLIGYLETKDPSKYKGLSTLKAYQALDQGVNNAFSTVTNMMLVAEGGISLYKAGSLRVGDIISSELRIQKQATEHTLGGSKLGTNSFLLSTDEAKSVLNATHSGDAKILSTNAAQNRVYVEYNNVTGYYNNNGVIAPTNKFLIKGGKSSTVVPIHQNTKVFK